MSWGLSLFWLLAMLGFLILEAVTIQLVSIWFAAGALVALLMSFFVHSFWMQLIRFLLVSALSLALVRPLVRRYLSTHFVPTNADRVLGREAVVTEEINNVLAKGTVLVDGMPWTARADPEQSIPVDSKVTVLRIEGVKLFVTPVRAALPAGKEL